MEYYIAMSMNELQQHKHISQKKILSKRSQIEQSIHTKPFHLYKAQKSDKTNLWC